MRYARKKDKEGFTLIELMIVVAIVGVLAVLAIYGVRKYIANSKTAEARNSLGQMGKDEATAYEKEGMSSNILTQGASTAVLRRLCGSSTAPVPGTNTFVSGKKYQSKPGDWNGAAGADATANVGFPCLKYAMDQPQYYIYTYTSSGTNGVTGDTFLATANGDLNGDGVFSTFQLTGSIGAGLVLNIAPNLLEVNPEE